MSIQLFVAHYVFERKKRVLSLGWNKPWCWGQYFFAKFFAQDWECFKLRRSIYHTSERHFDIIRLVLCLTSLKFEACLEACTCNRTSHMPKPASQPSCSVLFIEMISTNNVFASFIFIKTHFDQVIYIRTQDQSCKNPKIFQNFTKPLEVL